MNKKYKIGAFSKLCGVTVKALRLYEDLGLLTPAEIDEWTGYRYYELCQAQRLNRILHLKRLGLSLDEIGELFQSGSDCLTLKKVDSQRQQLCGRTVARKEPSITTG